MTTGCSLVQISLQSTQERTTTRHLGHCLHWDICLLHTNELPLRHLFQNLVGPTSGSFSFKGAIGKVLANVEDFKWCGNFIPILEYSKLCPLSQVITDLSTHQKGPPSFSNLHPKWPCSWQLEAFESPSNFTGRMAYPCLPFMLSSSLEERTEGRDA